MNSPEFPSLPSLLRTQARLAADVRRVEQIAAALLDDVERLFSAATADDWPAITRITRRLARDASEGTSPEVVAAAKGLSRSIRSSRPLRSAPQHLNVLLQACRDQQHGRRAAS